MSDIFSSWAVSSLFRRTDATCKPDDFEEQHGEQLAARYAEVAEGGREVNRLLLASNKILQVCLYIYIYTHMHMHSIHIYICIYIYYKYVNIYSGTFGCEIR